MNPDVLHERFTEPPAMKTHNAKGYGLSAAKVRCTRSYTRIWTTETNMNRLKYPMNHEWHVAINKHNSGKRGDDWKRWM